MSKERLDSDKVNYLIWRYLIESGYDETAVRLQKEWKVEKPSSAFDFAEYVTNHALVDVLNRGLLYNVTERELAASAQGANAKVMGVFGTLPSPPSPAHDEEAEENFRKRQLDTEQRQDVDEHPVKKPRLSNGYENGFDPTPMDLDDEQNGDENAYPSPEQAPSPPIVPTVGPEQGTQIDKVDELSTETTFLDLTDEPSPNCNPILLQCEFNPRDAQLLAAAGTDALGRMWNLPRTAHDFASDSDRPSQPSVYTHHNLLEENTPSSTTTTGISWSSDGLTIAVSSEPVEDGISKVEFWASGGARMATCNRFESPIICLRWNPTDSVCLAISPGIEREGTSLAIINPSDGTCIRHALAHPLMSQTLDATWTGSDEFVVGGGNLLQAFQYTPRAINPIHTYECREKDAIVKVSYDWRSRLLATASDTGMIDIWNQNERRSFDAHQGMITALAWQPIQLPFAVPEDADRLLASAGEDGAISIWNARSPDSKAKVSMTMASGVVALAFTPDGAFLAGATNSQVLIWKVEDATVPRATWSRGDDVSWRTPQSHDSSTDEDIFSLSWNSEGQKLAYGVNSRLAVIGFKR